jgi:glutamine amidotransferase
MIVVVDYGLGNLASVQRAIRYLGKNVTVTDNAKKIAAADSLILPGVGAFAHGMMNLNEKGLINEIKHFSVEEKPLLGICLGMQLLMSIGEESGINKGLDLIQGKVLHFSQFEQFDRSYKVPHIGWNALEVPRKEASWDDTILDGIPVNSYVYFVHSFVVVPNNDDHVLASTIYGDLQYCAVAQKRSIYGCQFHPENSGEVGLQILKNFLSI